MYESRKRHARFPVLESDVVSALREIMNAKAHKNAHARNHERESAQNRACDREFGFRTCARERFCYLWGVVCVKTIFPRTKSIFKRMVVIVATIRFRVDDFCSV